MKTLAKISSLLLVLTLFSCEKETTIEPQVTKEVVDYSTTVPIEDFNGDEIPGATSTLQRDENGITGTFLSKGLIPGNAYTLWFVVFGDAPGPPSSTFAAGYIADDSGKGNFAGHLSVGDNFDTPNSTMFVFNTPLTAEIHLVVRTHGPAQPGMVAEQISTIDGGCTSGFPSGPVLHPDSDVVGYCANIQAGMHPPIK